VILARSWNLNQRFVLVKKLVKPDKTKFRLCLRSNMQLE